MTTVLEGHEREYWVSIATRWSLVGPPLRPSDEDLAFLVPLLRPHLRTLVLGVTPELHQLLDPFAADLVAIDRSQAMIDALWPGPPGSALCASWLEARVPAASRDLVVADGAFHLLPHPQGQRLLARRLREVLAPGGHAVLRLFVPPDRREEPGAVLGDLLAGRLRNPNILKMRLAMAMQETPAQGVRLSEVWSRLHAAVPDLRDLALRLELPAEPFAAIAAYRDSKDTYHFVTLDEALALLEGEGGLRLVQTHVPSYDLGQRCPTVILQRP